MCPLSTFYEREVSHWLISHPGRGVTVIDYQIGNLLYRAFTRAAIIQTAIKGFENTGIYPFDKNIFPDHMYAPSETTIRPEVPDPEQSKSSTSGEAPDDEQFQLSTFGGPTDTDTRPLVPEK